MPELLTLQDLANGHLDAKALGEAANGDENTIVTTRTGNTYPSAERAINIMFQNGGLPATPFATKALMTASPLDDGKYAMVTEDTVNNGLYVKTAGAWVRSAYDPTSLANTYTDSRVDFIDDENILYTFHDADGVSVLDIRNDGGLYPIGANESLQESVTRLNNSPKTDKNLMEHDSSGNTHNFDDVNGVRIASISASGNLVINDVSTSGGSVDDRIKQLEYNSEHNIKAQLLKSADRAIAARDYDARLTETLIVKYTDSDVVGTQLMTPVLVRVARKKYLVVIAQSGFGDFASGDIIGYFLTVNDDYTITRSAQMLIAQRGTDSFGDYSATACSALYVNKGIHAGRIYVYYMERYGLVKDVPYYKYSDDEGETWSAAVNMSVFIPEIDAWRVTLVSPSKGIQIQEGEYDGRIVLPCWHGDLTYPDSQGGLLAFIMYSDDGGVTYTVGATSSKAGSNESAIASYDTDKLMFLTRDSSEYKSVETSYDGGITLTDARVLDEVKTTKIQSGLLQTKNPYDLSVPKLIISTPIDEANRGTDLGLYISYDNKDFSMVTQISTGSAKYSDLEVIDESHLLVVYVGNTRATIDAIVVNLKTIFQGE